jgi:hypothetical protein
LAVLGSKHGSWMLNPEFKCFQVELEAYKSTVENYLKK